MIKFQVILSEVHNGSRTDLVLAERDTLGEAELYIEEVSKEYYETSSFYIRKTYKGTKKCKCKTRK